MQKKVFRIVCLRIKFDLQLKKKKQKKNFGEFQVFLCRHQKNFQSYRFHIRELYDLHFSQKKPRFFHHQTVLLESNNPRKKFISFFNDF